MLKYEDPKKQKRIKELEKELEALYKNKKSSRRSSSLKPKSSKGRTRKTSETRRLSSCSPARSSSRKKKTDLDRDLASPQPTFDQVWPPTNFLNFSLLTAEKQEGICQVCRSKANKNSDSNLLTWLADMALTRWRHRNPGAAFTSRGRRTLCSHLST